MASVIRISSSAPRPGPVTGRRRLLRTVVGCSLVGAAVLGPAGTPASFAGAPVAEPRGPAASASVTQAVAVSAVAASTPAGVLLAAVRPTLHQGDHGAAVTGLQRRLKALHYDVGRVDGDFGHSTLHAVRAFQKVQRVHVDGVVGPVTWARFDDPTVPVARYRSSSAAVEIDLTLRLVYLTKDGAVTRVVDASPGKPSTPTPTGSFTVTRRIDGWRRSPLGLLWRPNYFHGGYAVHGSTSVPTYAASHGCVRVTVPAMNRLWPVLFVGEHVRVYR